MNSASGVEAAVDVGVGSTVTTTVGGVLDHRFAEPLTLTGTVEHIFDARFQITRGHMAGMRFNNPFFSEISQPAIGISASGSTRPTGDSP
jgi:microcystin degradation protein MlrC